MDSEWPVIPGSGTGELQSLRGDGGFKAQLGQQGTAEPLPSGGASLALVDPPGDSFSTLLGIKNRDAFA